jgi:uncharacterized membrane protein
MEQLLTKLIEMIQNKSPELWAMASKQVGVYNFIDILWVVIGLVVIVIFYNLIKRVKDEDDYDEDLGKLHGYLYTDDINVVIIRVFGWVTIFTFSIIVLVNLVTVGMRLYNPEYYILEALMNLVK